MIVQNSSQIMMPLAANEPTTTANTQVRTSGPLFANQLNVRVRTSEPLFAKQLVDYLNKMTLPPEQLKSDEALVLLPAPIVLGAGGPPVFRNELAETPSLPGPNPLPLSPEQSERDAAGVGRQTLTLLAPNGLPVSGDELTDAPPLPSPNPMALLPESSESERAPERLPTPTVMAPDRPHLITAEPVVMAADAFSRLQWIPQDTMVLSNRQIPQMTDGSGPVGEHEALAMVLDTLQLLFSSPPPADSPPLLGPPPTLVPVVNEVSPLMLPETVFPAGPPRVQPGNGGEQEALIEAELGQVDASNTTTSLNAPLIFHEARDPQMLQVQAEVIVPSPVKVPLQELMPRNLKPVPTPALPIRQDVTLTLKPSMTDPGTPISPVPIDRGLVTSSTELVSSPPAALATQAPTSAAMPLRSTEPSSRQAGAIPLGREVEPSTRVQVVGRAIDLHQDVELPVSRVSAPFERIVTTRREVPVSDTEAITASVLRYIPEVETEKVPITSGKTEDSSVFRYTIELETERVSTPAVESATASLLRSTSEVATGIVSIPVSESENALVLRSITEVETEAVSIPAAEPVTASLLRSIPEVGTEKVSIPSAEAAIALVLRSIPELATETVPIPAAAAATASVPSSISGTVIYPGMSSPEQRGSQLDTLHLDHVDPGVESRLAEPLMHAVAKDSPEPIGAPVRLAVPGSTVRVEGFTTSPDVIDEVGHPERVEPSDRSAELTALGSALISKDKTQRVAIRSGEPGSLIAVPDRQAVNPTLAVDAVVTGSEVQKRSSNVVAEVDRPVPIRPDVPQGAMRHEAEHRVDREALLPGLKPEGAPISLPVTSASEALNLVLPQRELSLAPELPSETGGSSPSLLLERPGVAISQRYGPRQNTVVLQLDPPELGSLVVHIQRHPEQLQASFWAESAEAKTLLQSHLPALQEALKQLGLPVEQVTLQLISDEAFMHQFGSEHGPSFGPSSDQQNKTFNFAQQHQGRGYSETQDPDGLDDMTPGKEGRERLVDIVI